MIKDIWFRFHQKRLEKNKLKFVSWFHSKFTDKYCWADCVGFSFNPTRFNPFKIESAKGCETESKEHDTLMCYCGGWQDGKCWDKLSKEEKEKVAANIDEQLNHKLPF